MNDFLKHIEQLFDMHSELDVEAAEASIRKNIRFSGMNVWILVCAIIIASLGLNVNSTAVIIGAMLISPLMGPIIGFGLSVGTDDLVLMRTSLKNLGIMVAISIIASTIFFLVSPLDMTHPSELLARTNPTIYDVLIAFVGGVAGALETSRKEKGTVISGVAIATALMPPLCTVGYGIANLSLAIAGGAFYLFFINCAFVTLATFLVVKYLRFPRVSHLDAVIEKRARRLATIFLVVLIIPSVFSAISVVRENNFNSKADAFVNTCRTILNGSVIYDYKTDPHADPASVTLYIAGQKLSDTDKETIFSCAEKEYGIGRYQINFEVAFASAEMGDFEKHVYTDMSSSIETMQQTIKAYESLALPHDQIGDEVKAIYPEISDISLARGSESVFAIITCADSTYTKTADNLEKWLEVRLRGEKIKVINVQQH